MIPKAISGSANNDPMSETESDNSTLRLLRVQMLKECKSMARYTMASGIKVATNIFQTIEAFEHEQQQAGNYTLNNVH